LAQDQSRQGFVVALRLPDDILLRADRITLSLLGLLLSLRLALAFFEVPLLRRAHLFGLPLHRSRALPLHSPILAPTQGPKRQRREIYGHPRRKPNWCSKRESEAADVEENES
jgi:hypothetical protein